LAGCRSGAPHVHVPPVHLPHAGLSKTYPGGKQILNNIHLQFYPDAKIGVLGVNGAGKSTLLKIMAGMDKEWTGEAWVAEGARVGYLPQEPQLDETKTVRGTSWKASRPSRPCSTATTNSP
jgi:ATPase subunit of ABC transporter with duplicated ATPase domains